MPAVSIREYILKVIMQIIFVVVLLPVCFVLFVCLFVFVLFVCLLFYIKQHSVSYMSLFESISTSKDKLLAKP